MKIVKREDGSTQYELETAKDIADVFLEGPIKFAEVVTGILSSDVHAHLLVGGRLLSSGLKFNLLTQLGREFQEYREKGMIKEDYFATHRANATLLELLKFIDGDIPEEEVFTAMKKIFFYSANKNSNEKDEEFAYLLLQICKKLSSLDVLVVKICYQSINKPELAQLVDYNDWARYISKQLGYDMPDILITSDRDLRGIGILSERGGPDLSSIRCKQEARLTSLGVKLGEIISV